MTSITDNELCVLLKSITNLDELKSHLTSPSELETYLLKQKSSTYQKSTQQQVHESLRTQKRKRKYTELGIKQQLIDESIDDKIDKECCAWSNCTHHIKKPYITDDGKVYCSIHIRKIFSLLKSNVTKHCKHQFSEKSSQYGTNCTYPCMHGSNFCKRHYKKQ